MNTKRALRVGLCACSLLAAVATTACGGSTIAVPPNGSGAINSPLVGASDLNPINKLGAKASTPLVYVSAYNLYTGGQSVVYSLTQKGLTALGAITQGLSIPSGMAVDKSLNLYVTNAGDNTVTVYPPGKTTPSSTYSDNLNTPRDAVVSKKGWVYVANGNAPSGVVSYPPGSTTASKTFVQLNGYEPQGIALDSAGDLYVSYTGQGCGTACGSPEVYKYPPHKTKGVNLGLPVASPLGLTFDGSGNLVIVDRQSPYASGDPAIEVFPPGEKTPSQVITYSGFTYPGFPKFDKKENLLYIDNCTASGGGQLFVFSYPAGELVGSVSFTACAAGVALAPPAAQ